MRRLSLTRLNAVSPYTIEEGDTPASYRFVTDSGVDYQISFIDDEMVQSMESYQFVITNLNGQKSPRDAKVKVCIQCLIEEFFEQNQAALLYICATNDGKQRMRSRLFEYWYSAYENKACYSMFATEFIQDGVENHASVIVRNDNPLLPDLMYEFYETVKWLDEKPN